MANFFQRIDATAARFPNHPAIEMTGPGGLSVTTYADLITLSGRFAGWLSARGLGRGDRVAILGGNSAHWIAAYLGTLSIGAITVPLDTAYTAAQVRTIVEDSGARVLLTSQTLHDTAIDAVLGLDPPVHVALLTQHLPLSMRTTAVDVQNDDAAAILYTSGTTADPKGVVLTHGNLEAERAGAFGVLEVTEHDAVLGVLPLFHALAQMANLLLPLSAGTRVVFLETVSSAMLLDALETRGITIFACVPQFFYLIHQRVTDQVRARGVVARAVFSLLVGATRVCRRLGLNPGPLFFGRVHRVFGPRMRLLITGGSRFDPAIARDLHGLGLTLLNGYGLTETSGAATLVRPSDAFNLSVGHPLPGVEVRIDPSADASPSTSGEREHDDGEVLIRGGVVMREYFGRPDATAETLENGWLRTGDLGRMDAAGRLHITGRKKEIIVLSSGKNLYPEEIEAHYRQSPFIKELCVLGVSDPGSPAAERLHAVIVPDEAVMRERGIVNVRELIRFEIEGLAVRLPAHKRVLSYDISFDPLPRTSTGKLKRNAIREQQTGKPAAHESTRRMLGPDERAWLEDEGKHATIAAIEQRLAQAPIYPDDNLELDLHLDSLERVEVLTMLEQRRGTRVPPAVRATIFTVRQLVDAVDTGEADSAGVETGEAGDEWQTLLSGSPDDSLLRDLERPAGLRAIVWLIALRLCRLIFSLFIRFRIENRSGLPAHGPYLITPNHQSFLDAFVLSAVLPFAALKQLFFVGASEYFATPLTRALARLANILPVDPDANLVTAMQAAAAGLRLKKILILFPEGERTIDGTLKPFRKGASILATHLDVPVVPVAIDGLYALWPRGRALAWKRLTPWNRPVVSIVFSPPVTLGQVSYADGTDSLRGIVATMLNAR